MYTMTNLATCKNDRPLTLTWCVTSCLPERPRIRIRPRVLCVVCLSCAEHNSVHCLAMVIGKVTRHSSCLCVCICFKQRHYPIDPVINLVCLLGFGRPADCKSVRYNLISVEGKRVLNCFIADP